MKLKDKVLEFMSEDPTRLFTVEELVTIFKDHTGKGFKGTTIKGVDNVLRNHRVGGRIYRHIDKKNKKFRYAVDIKTENTDHWVLSEKISQGNKGIRVIKKSKGLLSKKEIQSMFAVQYNMLARLEDESMKVIDQYETLEKELSKIKNVMGNL